MAIPGPLSFQNLPRHPLINKRIGRRFTVLALGIFLGFAHIAYGQADQGTITGVIRDSSGAVISDAGVTLANLDTGQVLKATTNRLRRLLFFADQDWQLQRYGQFSGLWNHYIDRTETEHAATVGRWDHAEAR